VIPSIAIVPQPPLLVPELVGAAAAEIEPLSTACQQAVLRSATRRWHAVGVDGSGPARVESGASGSFRGYGADVPVRLGSGPLAGGTGQAVPPGGLPLPMLVAGWLCGLAGAHVVTGELVHPATEPTGCLARGKELVDELSREPGSDWSVLVLADGARTHDAPGAGRVDGRAAGFDAAVAEALAAADAEALAAIDPRLADELGAQGRAAWQVLAGVAIGSGSDWTGELLYSAAPYGVGYHVALWRPR